MDFNEEFTKLEEYYGEECITLKDKDVKEVILLEKKNNIQAKLIIKLENGNPNIKFIGNVAVPELIVYEIEELLKGFHKSPVNLLKTISNIKRLVKSLILKEKKEKKVELDDLKSRNLEEVHQEFEIKEKEENYLLQIQKYVKQKGHSKNFTKVDFDNFVKNESGYIWKQYSKLSNPEFGVGTNGVYIAFVFKDYVQVYDTEKQSWKKVVPTNQIELDPSKCSVYFGSIRNSSEISLDVLEDNKLLTLIGDEHFFNSTESNWNVEKHELFSYDRNNYISFQTSEGYFVYSGIKPYEAYRYYLPKQKKGQFGLKKFYKQKLNGHQISKRLGMSYGYTHPNLYLYGGRDEKGYCNDLYSIDMLDFTVTLLLTYGPSPRLAFGLPLYPKGEDEYLLFGGYNGNSINENSYVINTKTNEISLFNPEIKVPIHIKGVSIQAKGKLYIYGGYQDLLIQSFQDRTHTFELEHSIELNTPSIYGDYSKWFRLQNSKESDVVFYFGLEQKRIYAHKFIIQITCPKLYKYIQEAEKRQKSIDEITEVYEIFDRKVYFNVFGTFIEFLYTFSLHIDPKVWNKDRFEMLLYLSEKFECKVLSETILGKLTYEAILSSHLSNIVEKNALQFITGKMFGENPPNPGNGIIKFVFDDGDLYSHKTLLMVRSPYFAAMFDKFGFQESETGIIETPEEIGKESLLSILEYFYTGKKPNVFANNVVGFYYAVSIYNIQELKPYLRSIISENVTKDNVFDILSFADLFKDEFMNALCATCLHKNYQELKNTEEFQNVPPNIRLMVFEKNSKEERKMAKKLK